MRKQIEFAAISLLICGCIFACLAPQACAQQLPPLPPTLAAPQPVMPQPRPAPPPQHRAHVEYTQDRLKITADNSSLNRILMEVGQTTGLKITGGVADERVFGTYGPGDIATVLAHLLDGSGSNMLLREDARRRPTELILTPRNGGPTPPSPASAAQTQPDTEDRPPDPSPHMDPNPAPSNIPQGAIQPGGSPQSSNPAYPATVPPPGTTTQQSPNGVKTPQQIYDQLIQMQKQNAPTAPK